MVFAQPKKTKSTLTCSPLSKARLKTVPSDPLVEGVKCRSDNRTTMTMNRIPVMDAILHGLMVSVLCVASYWLITQMLTHVVSLSRDDDLLGGMWAVIATIFVYRFCYKESVRGALSRISATILSFVLCFIYLLLFP